MGVELRSYSIIYGLIDDVRAAMEGRLKSSECLVVVRRAGRRKGGWKGCMEMVDGRSYSGHSALKWHPTAIHHIAETAINAGSNSSAD